MYLIERLAERRTDPHALLFVDGVIRVQEVRSVGAALVATPQVLKQSLAIGLVLAGGGGDEVI
jgi:hypothetical protein